MANTAISSLLDEKIRIFVASFEQTARDIFHDHTINKLRHPGEFGTFRESIVREFLRFFTPGRLAIHNGFIVTAEGDISTQCDIVIYDSKNTPLIETGERQRFFPVECACAIGEVKSILSKTDLKFALNKLAKVKALREKIPSPTIVRREQSGGFDPLNYAYDQLPTFLICQKFDFDCKNLPNEIDGMYETGIEFRHRHNLILSLQDGLLFYVDINGHSICYPELFGRTTPSGPSPRDVCRHRLTTPGAGEIIHIQAFCNFIFIISSSTTILFPDLGNYMPLKSTGGSIIDQKPPAP